MVTKCKGCGIEIEDGQICENCAEEMQAMRQANS